MIEHRQSKREFEIDNYVFKECLNAVLSIPGDFVEFGVYRGKSFMEVIESAKKQGKHAHAFDSFCGFAKPTEKDFEPETNHTIYKEGYLDTKGTKKLVERLTEEGYNGSNYTIWEGFIPDIFNTINGNFSFSFAYVDLDHYFPTKYALEWVWKRLSKNGTMLCDDFFVYELWGMSALAITEFIEEHIGEFDILRRTSRRIAFIKR